MRVLMIDDHVMFLQGLKSLLALLAPQLSIDTADTAASALRMVAEVSFELVLLDWHLADGEGEEVIERLRDAGCASRIVVLSGETDTRTCISTASAKPILSRRTPSSNTS